MLETLNLYTRDIFRRVVLTCVLLSVFGIVILAIIIVNNL